MTKKTAPFSVVLPILGGVCLLGIYIGMTPGLSLPFNAGVRLKGGRSEELPLADTERESGLRVRGEGSTQIRSYSGIDGRVQDTSDGRTLPPPQSPVKVDGQFVNSPNSQVGQNQQGSSPLKRATAFLANQEPETTKILAVFEGDENNFALTPEQLGISVAGDISSNEMTLRNQAVDEQAKLNALAQLTGAYPEKKREIAFLQEVAGNLSQPEAVRVGAFLKLADFGSSYVSSFSQSTDQAIQMELELLRNLEKYEQQQEIPKGALRAQINP
jgi:hypothetical protein